MRRNLGSPGSSRILRSTLLMVDANSGAFCIHRREEPFWVCRETGRNQRRRRRVWRACLLRQFEVEHAHHSRTRGVH